MAKKFFIRYNPHGNQVELKITHYPFRLDGQNWREVVVDKCCPDVKVYSCTLAERTFKSDVVEEEVDATYAITFSKDAVAMHTVEDHTSLQDAVDALNLVYAGFAVFSITDDTEVQVVVEACGTFSVEVEVTPAP